MDHSAAGRKKDSVWGKCISRNKRSIRATCWEKITRPEEGNGGFEIFAASIATKSWSGEYVTNQCDGSIFIFTIFAIVKTPTST